MIATLEEVIGNPLPLGTTWHGVIQVALETQNSSEIGEKPERNRSFMAEDNFNMPISIQRAKSEGPTLVVTAGIHGSEYTAIEAGRRLAYENLALDAGTLIVLPLINCHAFRERRVYINPEDGLNMNRIFPGCSNGSPSEQIAHWVMDKIVQHADAYIDLHSGDLNESLVPFSIYAKGDEQSRLLATIFGLPNSVGTATAGYTNTAGSRAGVPSIIAESGFGCRWSEIDVDMLLSGVMRIVAHLGMKPRMKSEQLPVRDIEVSSSVSEFDGFWYPFKQIAETVESGEKLGEIRSLEGVPLQTVKAATDGFVLFQMQSLSVNVAEPVIAIACAVPNKFGNPR